MTNQMTKRVVVGVDGSDDAREALRFAFAEAQLRDCQLFVLHAFDSPWTYWDAAVPISIDRVEEQQKELLAREIERVCGPEPAVSIQSEITNDLPARALIDKSKDAELIVVGSRGRGGFTGLMLGSVSQQVVHHAHCPVVVVPHGDRDD